MRTVAQAPTPLRLRPPGLRATLTIGGLAALVVVYTQLQRVADFLTYDLSHVARGSALGAAVAFFLFEVPKVLLLLTGVVFVVGVLRSFMTAERARRLLAGRRESAGNVLAAFLGIATPFCSCSAVPLFIGFVTAGVPLGVTFSFLVSAPMINEVALVLLFGLFGWRIAGLYLVTGLVIAIVSGWIIGRLKLEGHVEPWVWQIESADVAGPTRTWASRITDGRAAVREIVGKVWPYVVLGIAAGAGIHGYVPTEFLASVMGREAWWAIPFAVLLGIPMYANAAAVLPVVQALLGKGAALGTVLAFMMSVTALSLPEMIILRKVLRPALIATFVGLVAGGIVLVGLLFNSVM
jgi:uncharacterized membrane protein YraQ (UPF0718 family)